MLSWIGNLWGWFGRGVNEAFDFARQLVEAVWHKIVDLGSNVYAAWTHMWRGVVALAQLIERSAAAAFRFGWYVVHVLVPTWARWAITQAFDFARRIVADLRHWAEVAIRDVLHWATVAINTLTAWARAAVRVLTEGLHVVTHDLGLIFHTVYDWILHPEHLAKFIAGFIWDPLWRWLKSHAEGFAAWMLRHLAHAVLGSANFIEGILADLF